jgi:hypothetical protein
MNVDDDNASPIMHTSTRSMREVQTNIERDDTMKYQTNYYIKK